MICNKKMIDNKNKNIKTNFKINMINKNSYNLIIKMMKQII